MSVSRRSFILSGTAFAGCGLLHAAGAAKRPNLTFGVISDIHLQLRSAWNTLLPDKLKEVLSWYRAQDVDAIVIPGDMTESGLVHEIEAFAKAWFSVFPNDCGQNGKKVERIIVYGNHDVASWMAKHFKTEDERRRNMVCYDVAGVWERVFHEPYEPVFCKTVNGYSFVGAHWPLEPETPHQGWPIMAEAAEFLRTHAAQFDPARPFFYVQHSHPANTCYGSWAWGRDDGSVTQVLSGLPRAIALSGHSHNTLTDERSVWQGAFTSIGASSLAYSSSDYNFRENASANAFGFAGDRKPAMEHVPTGEGKQGMVVRVYDDHVAIERREFVWGESLGPDWIIPLDTSRPLAYDERRKRRLSPEFPGGAKVEVCRGAKIRLTFPSADPTDGCRAFDYEVRAVLVADDLDGLVLDERRFLDPAFHLPLSHARQDITVEFPPEKIPVRAKVRFEVRPIECFGKKGRPICSELQVLKQA